MLTKTDFKKYLFSAKNYIIVRYIAVRQNFKSLWKNIANTIKENKEMIFKLSFPLLLVLAVFYSCSSSQHRVTQNISDIFKISDDVRFHYADQPDYWGLSTQKILQDKFISEKYIRNGEIYLPGGEEILIGNGANADVVMPKMSSFDVILPHLNQAQCISYAEGKISDEDIVKLQRISIVNSGGTYSFEWGGTYKLPITKYASKDVCSHSDNTLIWTIQ